MTKLSRDLRRIELSVQKLTGSRRQAVGLRKKIETRLKQAAVSHARAAGPRQQAAAVDEAQLVKSLVRSGRAGWVNDPALQKSVLVERGTGCVLLDLKNKVITAPRLTLPSKPGVNKGDFVRYLRQQGIEEYVPHLYLDKFGHVTVGIGHLVPDAKEAKSIPFKTRGLNVNASPWHVERSFNKVKLSGMTNTRAPAFRILTNIFISEADAVALAMNDIDDFLRILRSAKYYPEFDTYPVLAKTGLLDLAYNVGSDEARFGYKLTTAAILRRNWREAGVQQKTGRDAGRVAIVQGWFNGAAQQEPFFISHTNCRKGLTTLTK